MDFSDIKNNLNKIRSVIPSNVELIAVSKTHPAEIVKEAYDEGQRLFGENKVQELVEKHETLPKDINWHLIGHLQTNKVKYIAPFIDTIQSVDSAKVLKEINKEAEKMDRKINVLLQVKIAKEDSKYGLSLTETRELYKNLRQDRFPFVTFKGLMGMATFTDDTAVLKEEFSILKNLFDDLQLSKSEHTLSMGMSGDYLRAIESGANSIRVGSAIFGQRN